ncbi:hypothetical protein C2E23DRAFT_869533 [Lenzites betulinus]|nr:hypothetical protein C2E23DRAFT_869533 [Lenzites betulinus]
MSRSSSPLSDADTGSPASHNGEHEEQDTRGKGSEAAPVATGNSLEDSVAGGDNDNAASREATTSPSPVEPASASGSAVPELAASTAAHAASSGTWQAVWSPSHSAYYFYNSLTHETTWENPLQPPNAEAGPSSAAHASSPTPEPTAASSSSADIYAAAAAQGIDPALAHLDPSLAAGGSGPGAFTYTAKFNARTGAFARPDARDPTHLSEFERAKRMSEFYFDVNAWESDVEMRKLQEAQEEESKKRKRPTKKDVERFKEQKRQKKLAKTAWLRT